MPRKVALYAHDLEEASPTGIGQYVRQLIAQLTAEPSPAPDLELVIGASPKRARQPGHPPFYPGAMRPRLPRRTLHLLWAQASRPRVDTPLGRPDLVHVLSPYTPVPTRAPVIYTIHDLMPVTNPEWYGRKERWLFRRALADATRRSPLLITNSQTTADRLCEVYGFDPGRTRVVHLGIDRVFFEDLDPAETEQVCRRHGLEPGRFVVAVGTVSDRKNLGTVIEAVGLLRRERRPLTLAAVGSPGAGYQATEQLVARLDLAGSVRMTGWLPGGTVRHLVAGSLALVHPSRYEGFGMTPLEAMAAGVPALVSDAGALPEVTGDAALHLPPGDPGAWAAALGRLLDEPAFRDDLVARGRARAAQFSWSRAAAETAAAYREALAL